MPALTRLLLLTFLIVLALAPTAAAEKSTFDYVANARGLSQPVYATEKTTIELPAFDGELLHIEVTKPKKAGHWPVILEASPYHGTLADREGTRILPDPRDEEGKSIGLTGFFAPRGYAVVMMDLRGTGHSQGCLDHLGPKDARDLEQVVEWAASRAWSNGRVGMTGHSYVGSTPSVAAAQRPKGLATIVPSAGLASMYHHQFQGGVPYMLQWTGVQWTYEYLTVARHLPPVGKDPYTGAETGDDFGNNTQYEGCGLPNSALTAGEDQLSGRYSKWHLERDWTEGVKEADIPVFAVHGVNDNAARVPALDWFLDRRDSRDKLWLGQWDHGSGCCPNRRGLQWTEALHAWFDKQLKGAKVNTGPDMELFLSDDQSFSAVREGARTEVLTGNDWPLADRRLRFYPKANGKMSPREPKRSEAGTHTFTGTKEGFSEFAFVDPTWETGVSFETAQFDRDMLMAGLPRLELHASVTAPRVHLIANLLDEDAEGKRRRISQFAINPELRDGIATRKTVTPGQRYELRPPAMAMAHRLRKGHRLVLQVTTSDPDKVPFFSEDPEVTVFTGPGATMVAVPVVDGEGGVRADDVPLQVERRFDKPAHDAIETTVTTGAPGADARPLGVGSQYVEFALGEGEDNARAEAVAVPSQQADIDLYVQRKAADGSWEDVETSSNGSELDKAAIAVGDRLEPGQYRLVVHNYIGPPDHDVAVKMTFFDTAGQSG
ncbi:MAG TPA: CocE/NonD family hydrolase [Solirubrobacteraceae bacterium]|jgi:putative CocE/NonD family hydrolase